MKDKIWNILLTVALGAVALIVNSTAAQIKDNASQINRVEMRITSIEASRFTTADGFAIQKQLSDIRESLARLETRQAMKP